MEEDRTRRGDAVSCIDPAPGRREGTGEQIAPRGVCGLWCASPPSACTGCFTAIFFRTQTRD